MKESYNKGVTDEFVIPFVCEDPKNAGGGARATSTIRDEDSCICFNFRADRVRQITRALARNSGLNEKGGSDLPGAADLDATIPSDRVPSDLHYVCMTQYDKNFSLPVVIPAESMANILANVMGGLNMRNLRVAETEKYAHVTYFFNGGVEQPFPGIVDDIQRQSAFGAVLALVVDDEPQFADVDSRIRPAPLLDQTAQVVLVIEARHRVIGLWRKTRTCDAS